MWVEHDYSSYDDELLTIALISLRVEARRCNCSFAHLCDVCSNNLKERLHITGVKLNQALPEGHPHVMD